MSLVCNKSGCLKKASRKPNHAKARPVHSFLLAVSDVKGKFILPLDFGSLANGLSVVRFDDGTNEINK